MRVAVLWIDNQTGEIAIAGQSVADGDESGGIDAVNQPTGLQAVDTVDGIRTNKLHKGLNIVRMTGGAVNKIMLG